MQGTEILAVRDVRTCEYADGCDEVAMPGSTCCWRHRRHGKLFGVPPAAPAILANKVMAEMSQGERCWCGAPKGHRGMHRGQKRRDAENGNGTRSIQVSAEARDALKAKPNVFGDVDEAEALFTVKMTEPMLDTFWGLLDGKSKAALLSKMGVE